MRPKKLPASTRSKTVRFRLSDIEALQLSRTAEECGMSVSDYIRASLFGTSPTYRLTDEQEALLRDVRSIRLDLDRVSHYWRAKHWGNVQEELQQIVQKLKPLVNL